MLFKTDENGVPDFGSAYNACNQLDDIYARNLNCYRDYDPATGYQFDREHWGYVADYDFNLSGGYGYNWVLGKRWLIHFSMLPTFVVYNRNNFTVNDERKKAKHMRFNMIFNERVAIVHNFSSRYFAGATLVMNNSIFDDNVVIVNQNKWRARAFFGLRL